MANISVTFRRPVGLSQVETLSWEITVARTIYQHAKDEKEVDKLLSEATALQVVDVLTTTSADSVKSHISQALAHLFQRKTAALMYADAGVLAVLIDIANSKATRFEALKQSSDPTDEEPENALENSLACLAQAAQSKRLIPKIATHVMSAVQVALCSNLTRLRIAAGSLAVNLFAGGSKVWDLFVRAECLPGVKEMLRLANDQEALLALKLIEYICADERFMIQVRVTVGMESIVFWSLSPNTDISTTSKSILDKSKYKSLQGVPMFDPVTDLTWGRAVNAIQHTKAVSSFTPLGVKTAVRSGQLDAQQWMADTQTTSYPFMTVYPTAAGASSTTKSS
eukprot:c2524_g1_i1.p1 GENE.c2524_g1_i1~~c2524_g1_i1.p1  ORF type:complete len:352 (+),score=75.37 c2524_g1_i1:41-1057(+)